MAPSNFLRSSILSDCKLQVNGIDYIMIVLKASADVHLEQHRRSVTLHQKRRFLPGGQHFQFRKPKSQAPSVGDNPLMGHVQVSKKAALLAATILY